MGSQANGVVHTYCTHIIVHVASVGPRPNPNLVGLVTAGSTKSSLLEFTWEILNAQS